MWEKINRGSSSFLLTNRRKLKKQPLPKKEKVAIVACMNKLLKCLHAMIRNGTKYDYSYTVSTDH
jgi:transposase